METPAQSKLKQLPQAGVEDFRRAIRSAARGLWSGQMDLFGFMDTMVASIQRGLTRAWIEGITSCGMTLADMNPDEIATLEAEINTQVSYALDFGNDILEMRRSGARLHDLYSRVEMWVNRYHSVSGLAQSMSCSDLKLKWVWNPLKEHCGSCRRLNGRVYRASTWNRYNIYPRMHRLECRGFHCGCYFEPTTDPVTPGRPPMI